jgi:hypothetical protein
MKSNRIDSINKTNQCDRVIEFLCDENLDIRRLLQVHQSLCEQRAASPYLIKKGTKIPGGNHLFWSYRQGTPFC